MSSERRFISPQVLVLTQESLKESKNPFLKEQGVNFSTDKKGRKDQLLFDALRNLKIGGVHFKSLKSISWEDFLNQQFSVEQQKLIAQHYSQGPQLLASAPLGICVDPTSSRYILRQPDPSAIDANIYRKDNNIFIRIEIKNINSFDFQTQETLGVIPGPFELVFELDENLGFQLLYMTTSSLFIRDVYLGQGISEERILNATVKNDFINTLIALVKEYIQRLGIHIKALQKEQKMDERKIDSKMEKRSHLYAVLNDIQRFQNNDITLFELIGKLKKTSFELQSMEKTGIVDSMFSKMSIEIKSGSEDVLQDILKRIEQSSFFKELCPRDIDHKSSPSPEAKSKQDINFKGR